MRAVAIVLALALLSSPAFAGPPSICFTFGDAQKILRQVEKDLPDCRRELYANRIALDNGASEALRECRSSMELYQDRIKELVQERDRCVAIADNTVHAGEEAVSAARGPWYKRVLAAGKWVLAGAAGLAVVGFALRK